MAEPFTSKKWALWVQPDGPNTTMHYLGCHTLDDVSEAGNGIKDLIRCFRADGTGWDTLGATRNPPDPITTTITGLIEEAASWLETIVEGGRCPFPLYINGKLCPPYDVFGGASRWYTLENAEIGTTTLSGLAHRDEDNPSEQAFEVSAWPPMVRGHAITTDRITFTGTENLNDIASCSTPRCAGDCNNAVSACQMLVAVADGDPAAADVWVSYDNGATWTATVVDPYLGATTDLKSVTCFAIDEDTSRMLVLREAVATAGPAVYYSDDGGANWTEVFLGTALVPLNFGGVYGGALFSLDQYHIWAVVTDATNSRIYFSSDGGATWTLQYTLAAHVLYALHFSDANIGMCVGTTDDVYTTTDGGTTWAAATATGGADTNYCVTEGDGNGYWWIGTNAGELWYSDDHGVTWAIRAFPGSGAGAVYSIDFVSDTVGFMVHSPTAATGRLYRTRNGGTTWELESATIAGELYSVLGCTTNAAFAVGEVDTTAIVLKAHD